MQCCSAKAILVQCGCESMLCSAVSLPEPAACINWRAMSSPTSTSHLALEDWYLVASGFRSAMVNSAITATEETVVMLLLWIAVLMQEMFWYRS